MGTCPYKFSTPCTGSFSGDYSSFTVRVRNALHSPNASVSWTVHIQYPTRKIFFNKQLIKTPYRWPNVSSVLISIDYDGSKFSVTNADTVQVTFDQANACLRVPDIPEFQGNQTLCGSAGNLDGNPYDDIADINGTYLVNYNDTDTMLKMIDTWRVPLNEWLYGAPYDDISCMSGYDMRGANQCREQQNHAQQGCLPIRQASGGTGIFEACKDMGPGVIQKYYDDCVMDVCSDETFLCAEFGCSDGCTCNPNYVMDMTHLEQLTCILITECGCTDEFGQPHSAHDVWLTDSCQLYNYCSNGTHIEKVVLTKYSYLWEPERRQLWTFRKPRDHETRNISEIV
ncbi:hypothetical protein WR25_11940 [Diploscapter pachys]|uniref:VWFD domain-containing protein n=1 Tax=Diploscapter pachys TaxID=2018661 RepID=A0A2A2KK91_9BILA|nr:hypothetical protein WR25_11940 [Diploscapter pachys]